MEDQKPRIEGKKRSRRDPISTGADVIVAHTISVGFVARERGSSFRRVLKDLSIRGIYICCGRRDHVRLMEVNENESTESMSSV